MQRKSNVPKTILITGASSGIGAALAKFYAAEGVFLALTGRHQERLNDVAAKCTAKGAHVKTSILDVRDQTAIHNYMQALESQNYNFDLVIANAGISGGTGDQKDCETESQARNIFDVNVQGVLNIIEAALPHMIKRQSGQIALMSSLASFQAWPGAPMYSASKAWVRVYGEALHGSLKSKNVRVNVICPGFVRTPMTDINPYRMPFMIDADKAACIIAGGLKRNKIRIAFPWQTYLLSGFFGLLPAWLGQKIVSNMPAKPSTD